jgi:uncharacterized membrane protein required for colicin V production
MNLNNVPSNWVDLLTGVVLFVGILRGRKRGMSLELLDTLQWIAIVVLAGLYYRTVAQFIAISPLMGKGFYNVTAYLLIVVTLKTVVVLLKRELGEKIVGADLFGRGEYYLGMVAGMVRFACIYFVALSILHAPYYSEQMLAEDRKSQEKNFGDIRFPTLGGTQQTFFKASATGWAAEKYLAEALIQPTDSKATGLRDENSLARRNERAVDAIMGVK